MSVAVTEEGEIGGTPVRQARLESGTGVAISIISYGARIRDWRVPVGGGLRPVVLGYEAVAAYGSDPYFFGSTVGRVANRTGGARFTLDGREYRLDANEGANHLHGGSGGLWARHWTMEPDGEAALRCTFASPDGDMGYPGAVDFEVVFRLEGNRLTQQFGATVSERTPVNMVEHHYFNLMGGGDVLGHRLQIEADACTPCDETLIPTGEIVPVEGTPFDFRQSRPIGSGEGTPYDLNMMLRSGRDRAAPAATAMAPDGSLTLRLWTDQPGLQFYDGGYVERTEGGLDGAVYGPHSGFCLEDQGIPDALNKPNFPSVLVSPDQPYTHSTTIEIG